jgi:hypothetical protein
MRTSITTRKTASDTIDGEACVAGHSVDPGTCALRSRAAGCKPRKFCLYQYRILRRDSGGNWTFLPGNGTERHVQYEARVAAGSRISHQALTPAALASVELLQCQ